MVEYSPPMKHRIPLVILTLTALFWLGGLTSRAVIANEFFIPGTLEYDPNITMEQELLLFQLIQAMSIFILICYSLVLSSIVIVLRKFRFRFKENGWLLMACILFFAFIPVEFFTGYLDLKFILLWEHTKDLIRDHGIQRYTELSTVLRETLSHRIGALSGIPVIATLSYFTAVAVIVLRPLRVAPQTDKSS